MAYDPLTGKFTPDPVVVGGTPFGQAGTAQAPQTPMSYGGTSFGQAGSAAPTTSNEYQSVINEVNKTIKDAEKALTLAKKSGNKKNIAAAQSLVDLSKGELSDLVKLAGSLGATGGAGGGGTDQYYTSTGSTGTSSTGQRYINGRLVSESEFNKFLYGDQKGSGAAGGQQQMGQQMQMHGKNVNQHLIY
jgi:hypothetical protein